MALAALQQKHRAAAALAVAVFHGLLLYALVLGFKSDLRQAVPESLKLITLEELPPPEPVVTIPDKPTRTEEGAAAPPSLEANPAPIVAPPTPLPVPPVLATVPERIPVVEGRDASAGVATVDGTGSGTGGEGNGSGSGGSGSGAGAGGGRDAERIAGRINNKDYPRSALQARAQGNVAVRYTVQPDGRVGGCTVVRSSGHPSLDETTCRLIERRFRYRPALDASGRPTRATEYKSFDWSVPASAF